MEKLRSAIKRNADKFNDEDFYLIHKELMNIEKIKHIGPERDLLKELAREEQLRDANYEAFANVLELSDKLKAAKALIHQEQLKQEIAERELKILRSWKNKCQGYSEFEREYYRGGRAEHELREDLERSEQRNNKMCRRMSELDHTMRETIKGQKSKIEDLERILKCRGE